MAFLSARLVILARSDLQLPVSCKGLVADASREAEVGRLNLAVGPGPA